MGTLSQETILTILKSLSDLPFHSCSDHSSNKAYDLPTSGNLTYPQYIAIIESYWDTPEIQEVIQQEFNLSNDKIINLDQFRTRGNKILGSSFFVHPVLRYVSEIDEACSCAINTEDSSDQSKAETIRIMTNELLFDINRISETMKVTKISDPGSNPMRNPEDEDLDEQGGQGQVLQGSILVDEAITKLKNLQNELDVNVFDSEDESLEQQEGSLSRQEGVYSNYSQPPSELFCTILSLR